MSLTPSTTPVTLNLFQGPSRLNVLKLSAARLQASGAVSALFSNSAQAAKWILKQVQDDAGFWKADHA